jgi:hypothetical protein
MAVNMAYVPKHESGTKVLNMTPPWNGIADIALTSEKQKRQPFSGGGSRSRQISRATEVKIAYLKKFDSSYL